MARILVQADGLPVPGPASEDDSAQAARRAATVGGPSQIPFLGSRELRRPRPPRSRWSARRGCRCAGGRRARSGSVTRSSPAPLPTARRRTGRPSKRCAGTGNCGSPGVELIELSTRSLGRRVSGYIRELTRRYPDAQVTVLIPETEPAPRVRSGRRGPPSAGPPPRPHPPGPQCRLHLLSVHRLHHRR